MGCTNVPKRWSSDLMHLLNLTNANDVKPQSGVPTPNKSKHTWSHHRPTHELGSLGLAIGPAA